MPIIRFGEVASNFFRGSAPNENDIKTLQDSFGIKHIITLDQKIGDEIHDICISLGLNHTILPITDCGENDEDTLDAIFENGPNSFIKEPTYVHCRHGKDRTGLFVALYKIENGENFANALNEALTYGFGTGLDSDTFAKYIHVVSKYVGKDIDPNTFNPADMLCEDCGMAVSNNECLSCKSADTIIAALEITNIIKDAVAEKDKKKTVTELAKEEGSGGYISNVGDSNFGPLGVSTLFSVPEDQLAGDGKITKKESVAYRKLLLSYMNNMHIKKKAAGQLSFAITPAERKAGVVIDELLQSLVNEELVDIENHIDILNKPFTGQQGITPEQAEAVAPHFHTFANVMRDNLLKLLHKLYKIIKLFQQFESDSEAEAILNAINSQIETIKEQEDILEKILTSKSYDDSFQKHVLDTIDILKTELTQFEELINDRALVFVKNNILDETWSSSIADEIEETEENQ